MSSIVIPQNPVRCNKAPFQGNKGKSMKLGANRSEIKGIVIGLRQNNRLDRYEILPYDIKGRVRKKMAGNSCRILPKAKEYFKIN